MQTPEERNFWNKSKLAKLASREVCEEFNERKIMFLGYIAKRFNEQGVGTLIKNKNGCWPSLLHVGTGYEFSLCDSGASIYHKDSTGHSYDLDPEEAEKKFVQIVIGEVVKLDSRCEHCNGTGHK